MRLLGFFLCIVFLILPHYLSGQESVQYSIQRFGANEGLSHRWTNCLHQDKAGLIWIGTLDGLNKYDGNGFTTYRASQDNPGGKTPDVVNYIAEDNNGKLYVNVNDVFYRFDPVNEKFTKLLEAQENESIVIINQSYGQSLMKIGAETVNNAKKSILFYTLSKEGDLHKVGAINSLKYELLSPLFFKNNKVWFWNYNGEYITYDIITRKIQKAGEKLHAIIPIDQHGMLSVPNDQGLRSYSLPTSIAGKVILFKQKGDSTFWFVIKNSKEDYSLVLWDVRNKKIKEVIAGLEEHSFTTYRIDFQNISTIITDKEGIVWVASFFGLYKCIPIQKRFKNYLSLPVKNIDLPPTNFSTYHIAEGENNTFYTLVIPFRYIQVNKIDGSYKEVYFPPIDKRIGSKEILHQHKILEKFKKGTNDGPKSIVSSDTDILWIFSPTGLSKYDKNNHSYEHYFLPLKDKDPPHFLFDDTRGNICIAIYDTLFVFNKSKEAYQKVPLKNKNVTTGSAYIQESNDYWWFNKSEMFRYNLDDKTTEHIRLKGDIRTLRTMILYQGWYWVATSQGLLKLNPKTYEYTEFNKSNGLAGDLIYSLIPDNNYIWLGTSDGLSCFNIATNQIKNYTVKDGLSHNEFNAYSKLKSADGMIYMGGMNGINSFNPNQFYGSQNAASRLLLSKIEYFDENENMLQKIDRTNISNGIVFKSGVNTIQFHLALTSYLNPSKNQYAWRVDGLDHDWYYAGNQNIALYRHLPAGKYTFRAKAADSNGDWKQDELVIHFEVLRPWYAMWWAYLLYGMIIGGSLYSLYRFQIRKKMSEAETMRLQELDKFKTNFFTNITHEFKTPLTLILGLTDDIKAMSLSKNDVELGKKSGILKRNGEALLRLINQILDLAKLDASKLKIHYEQGDIIQFISYLAESIHSFANSKEIILNFESVEKNLIMDFDQERLLQILHNLLCNAIKFTPHGGKVILQVSQVQNNGKPYLSITVSDTGQGIASEHLPKIFDRFYQVEKTVTTGGSGIGLNLTYELVKAMDGTISVSSETDKGSTFSILLPITNKAPRMHMLLRQETSERSLLSVSQAPADSPSILIIEDNVEVMDYLSASLSIDYRLELAYNGLDGIDKAFEFMPDLILSDVMMPGKDGFEVCATVKNDDRTSHIPIILLTAKSDVESRIAGLKRGADAYLAKPFNKEELSTVIHNLLESRKKLQKKYLDIATGSLANLPLKALDIASPEVVEADAVENEFLQKIHHIIRERMNDAQLNVDIICREAGMSRSNLYAKIKALTGQPLAVTIKLIRMKKAIELLTATDKSISDIAYEVGFADPNYFSKVFSEEYGMSPSKYRNRG